MDGPWQKYSDPALLPSVEEEEEEQAPATGPWSKYQRPDYDNMSFGDKIVNDATSFGVLAESTMRGLGDNLLNTPNAIGDVIGNVMPGMQAGMRFAVQRPA